MIGLIIVSYVAISVFFLLFILFESKFQDREEAVEWFLFWPILSVLLVFRNLWAYFVLIPEEKTIISKLGTKLEKFFMKYFL